MTLWWILAGIIIWQLFMLLFYLLSGEDEDKTAIISMGIFVVIIFVTMTIIRAIRLEWYKRNLVAVQVKNRFKVTKSDGSIYYKDGSIFYTTKKVKETLKYDTLNQVKSCNNDVMYIQFSDCSVKSAPHKREIWRGEKIFNDLDMTQFAQTKTIN